MRRAQRYARRNGLGFDFDPSHGKGSHGTIRMGDRITRVQHGEIPRRTYFVMLRQLGIESREF